MSSKKDLSKTVMRKIEKEGIKIRSKYLVLAEKLGLSSVFILSIIMSALFINLILFWLKTTQNLDFLSFGSLGVLAFLEFFSYLWLVVVVVLLIVASLLLKKYDISYKKPYKWLVLGILFLAVLTGGAVAVSGVNEELAQQVSEGRFFPLRPFYGRGYGMRRKNGIVGKVIKVNKDSLLVDVNGQSINVIFNNKTHFPEGQDFQTGDWVRAVGEQKESGFNAFGMRKMKRSPQSFRKFRKGNGRRP